MENNRTTAKEKLNFTVYGNMAEKFNESKGILTNNDRKGHDSIILSNMNNSFDTQFDFSSNNYMFLSNLFTPQNQMINNLQPNSSNLCTFQNIPLILTNNMENSIQNQPPSMPQQQQRHLLLSGENYNSKSNNSNINLLNCSTLNNFGQNVVDVSSFSSTSESSFSATDGWKCRSGERDDLPNPRRVIEILRELEKSQKEMNELRDTPQSSPGVKRERNRVASRTCRLKKKAAFEINKIKVFHLDHEYKALCKIIKEVCGFILANGNVPAMGANTYSNFYHNIKEKYIPNGRMATGNLDSLVDDILRNFASGDYVDYFTITNQKL